MQYYLVHGGPIINGNDNEANIGTVSAKLVFNLVGTNDFKKLGNMFLKKAMKSQKYIFLLLSYLRSSSVSRETSEQVV